MDELANPRRTKRATDLPLYNSISKTIHPDDEMFRMIKRLMPQLGEAANQYFFGGGFVALSLVSALRAQGIEPARSTLLDFGAGYGRVTRHLVHLFREVTIMDLDPEMISFARSEFGVRGYLSHPSIELAQWPARQFDVVFSFSVFTHFHPDIWCTWFERVFDCVRAGGYLIITTRGVAFHKARGGTIAGDFDFVEKNENMDRLDPGVYGQMTVSNAYIERQIAHLKGRLEYLERFEGGDFDLYQEAHVFRRLA